MSETPALLPQDSDDPRAEDLVVPEDAPEDWEPPHSPRYLGDNDEPSDGHGDIPEDLSDFE